MRRLPVLIILALLALGPSAHATTLTEGETPVDSCRMAASTPLPVGTGECPGVRPGALHRTTEGECTFNFLFAGSDGHRYIGSAGHCALPEPGEKLWPVGKGSKVYDTEGLHIGEFAYAWWEGSNRGPDFALVRLKHGVEAEAAMCHFGGPTGINDDITSEPVILHWFGHGGFLGWEPTTRTNTLPARSAFGREGLPDPEYATATGPVFFGDSGSGVISEDGRAVGIAVTLRFNPNTMGITRLTYQLEQAEEMLGIQLRLRRAELN